MRLISLSFLPLFVIRIINYLLIINSNSILLIIIQTFIKNDKLGRFVERRYGKSQCKIYVGIKIKKIYETEYNVDEQLMNQKEDT